MPLKVRIELATESINGQHGDVLTEGMVEEDINKTIRRGKHAMKYIRFKNFITKTRKLHKCGTDYKSHPQVKLWKSNKYITTRIKNNTQYHL